MTTLDVIRFSSHALLGHKLRTGLSLLGVAVGVTSVVVLTSLGEGARQYVTGEFTSLGSNLLVVVPGRTETTGFAPPIGIAPHDLTLDDAEALGRLPGVRRVAPMAIGTATARAGDLTRDVLVVGVTAEWQLVRRIEVQQGAFIPANGTDRALCVVGTVIQQELFPGRTALGEMLRVGDERFRVIGVLAPRGTSLGVNLDEIVIVPVGRHMRMFNETTLPRVLVEMFSRDELSEGKTAVQVLLTARHDENDVTVETQESLLASFSRLLAVLTAALTGIAAISLSVAGVGIMNVMLVSVSERTREIGLLKAVGATSSHVLQLFLAEAAALSVVGGLAGLVSAALLAALGRRLFPACPIQAPSWAAPAAIVVSLSVGLVFGVWPARRAARLDPIRALTRR